MVSKTEISSGDIFNRLTIVEEVDKHVYPSGNYRRKFKAVCTCGVIKDYLVNQLTSGKTKSCGCLNTENLTSHGMHKTRQYQCWADMKTRCDSKTNKFYDYYGGRGIKYCEKWKTFEGFWEDMSETYSDLLTINRRDNDGDYCKENCQWDTKNFQGHMRRKQLGTELSVIGGTINKNNFVLSASIKRDSKRVHLGNYKTEQEVAEAYDRASELIYGDRPNKTISTRGYISDRVNLILSDLIDK